MIRRVTLPALLFASTLLTGCAALHSPTADLTSHAAIEGKVIGGQNPIAGSAITLYAVGVNYGGAPVTLATATTTANGNFTITSANCPANNPGVQTYILAQGGNPGVSGNTVNPNIRLGAALGPCANSLNANININEVTTVAMAFALSHFFTNVNGTNSADGFGAAGSGNGLMNAVQYTVPLLVNNSRGTANTTNTTSTTPAVTTTLESAKLYSLANSIAACVNSTGTTGANDTTSSCGMLFALTTPPASSSLNPSGGPVAPSDTLQAAVQIARYPYQNVTAIYNLASAAGAPFSGLASAPNDWTIGVSYSSPAYQLGVYGTSTSNTTTSIDIDAQGNVWFPSTLSSAPGLANFSPATNGFNGPYATALKHSQYLAIDSQGNVYGTDLAAAQVVTTPAASPAMAGTVYTTNGFTGPIGIDYGSATQDAVVFTSGGVTGIPGNALTQEFNGALNPITTFSQPANSILAYGQTPQDGSAAAAISQNVDAGTSGSSTVCKYEVYGGLGKTPTVPASTSASPCFVGGIAPTDVGNDNAITTSTNQVCDSGGTNNVGACFTPAVGLNNPKGIALDGDLSLWIANAGNASISTLYNFVPAGQGTTYTETPADYQQSSTVQYLHDSTHGGTLVTPYGLAIDNSGNVWVSNATCVTTPGVDCTTTTGFTLSELIGAAGPTITPLAVQSVNFTYGMRP